jgi:hypothetical protein
MNNRVSKIGDIEVSISRDGIKLGEGKNSVPYTPAEADSVAGLLATANSLAGMKTPPPHITHTPFRITFENGEMVLFRKGQTLEEGYRFTFSDIDATVRAINESVKMFRDEQVHRGGPRNGRTSDTGPEPPMDGLV